MQICGRSLKPHPVNPHKRNTSRTPRKEEEEEGRYFGRSWLQHANLIQIRSAFRMANFAKVKTFGGAGGGGGGGAIGGGWETSPRLSLSLGYRGARGQGKKGIASFPLSGCKSLGKVWFWAKDRSRPLPPEAFWPPGRAAPRKGLVSRGGGERREPTFEMNINAPSPPPPPHPRASFGPC